MPLRDNTFIILSVNPKGYCTVFGCLVLFKSVVHCRSEAIPQWPGLIQLGFEALCQSVRLAISRNGELPACTVLPSMPY